MTHPDDEISICAWIAHVAAAGADRVWISWTHHTPARESEGRAVARRLGVPDGHVYFHGGTDGAICDEIAQLRPGFQAMMDEVQPDRVVCGAFEQGHLDHDATNYLVNSTFPGMVLEVPFYHTYLTRLPRVNRFADPKGEEVLALDSVGRALKKEIAQAYPSQAIWKNMVFAELWARITGDGSLMATERMRLQTSLDFTTPNLPERLSAKVQRSERWKRWLAAMARL